MTYIKKLKEGLIMGIGFLLTISIGIFAYENTYVEIVERPGEGDVLSSNTFNQLLENVNYLKKRNDTIRQGTQISNTEDFYIGYGPENIGIVTELNTREVIVSKGVYIVRASAIGFRNIQWVRVVPYINGIALGSSNIAGGLPGQLFFTNVNSYGGADTVGALDTFVLKIKENNTRLSFKYIDEWPGYNGNFSGNSLYRGVAGIKISD